MIGTTLLSVLVSLLFGALYTTSRSAREGQSRLDDLDARRSVQSFIRRQLEAAAPLTDTEGETQHVLFTGTATELRFVGHLPAHVSGGGLQLVILTLQSENASDALILFHRNAWPDTSFPSTGPDDSWTRETLARGIDTITMSYYGSADDDGPAGWRDQWAASDQLPELVRLDILPENGRRWPPLTIGVRSRTATGQPHLLRSAPGDTV